MLYDDKRDMVQPMTPWIYNKLYLRDKAGEVHAQLDSGLTFAEDSTFLYLYMLLCKKISIVDACFYHYRYRDASAVHRVDRLLLSKINRIYEILYPVFETYPQYDLLFQLQKWVQVLSCSSMSERMGFDQRVYTPQFVMDTDGLKDKKIILYGAGRVGCDLHRQFEKFSYNEVLWVDKNFAFHQQNGRDVWPPQKIMETVFDVVCIAVESSEMAKQIRSELLKMGVPEEKIDWKPLYKLY